MADLSGRAALRRGRSVAAVELGGETVLLSARTGRAYHLDARASLVWACLDGTATVDEMARDLAREFDASVHRIRRDVMELTSALGRLGLLEDGREPSAGFDGRDDRQRILDQPGSA